MKVLSILALALFVSNASFAEGQPAAAKAEIKEQKAQVEGTNNVAPGDNVVKNAKKTHKRKGKK